MIVFLSDRDARIRGIAMAGQPLQVLYIDNYRWQEAEAVRRARLGCGVAGGEGPGVGAVPSKR
jgi:hypothetical protein